MANVKDWVAKIRAAVYGKDVRESIAASIEAMNNECEEAVGGYDEAIENAEQAITQAQTAAGSATSAASAANTAANRANEAAERVEDMDVSQLIQRINDLEAQMTPETALFWEYEESSGSGRIEAYASACGGMVEYYAVLFGTFTADTYTGMLPEVGSSQGAMVLLETLGPQYIPALNTIGTAPTQESYAATFTGNSGLEENPATVQLNFLCAEQVSMQSVNVDLNGHRSYLVPNVIYLGKCKSQTGPGYMNRIPISTDASGAVYNGTGYKTGMRLNSSGGETSALDVVTTGFIPFHKGDTLRVRGEYWDNGGGCYIALYDADRALIHPLNNDAMTGGKYGSVTYSGSDQAKVRDMTYSCTDITGTTSTGKSVDDTAYVRFSCRWIGESSLIATVNQEIT